MFLDSLFCLETNMTRNTELRKFIIDEKEIIYRTLTINEIKFLNSIDSEIHRYENAYRLAIYEKQFDPSDQQKFSIGKDIIFNSQVIAMDQKTMDLAISQFRNDLNHDHSFTLMIEILKALPNISMLDLLQLTYKDIVELTVMAEMISGKKFLSVGGKGNEGPIPEGYERVDGKLYFKEDGKSLQEKIDENVRNYR